MWLWQDLTCLLGTCYDSITETRRIVEQKTQLLLLSLLVHLTKAISISSVSNSQHWEEKFSAQEIAFRPQYLPWEAPRWRLSHNLHPKHCLHPAPEKESEYVLDCHPLISLPTQLHACRVRASLLLRAWALHPQVT